MMASARRSCKHDPDNFCYVCGVFLNVKSVKYTIVQGNLFCSAYKAYFGVQVGDQDKSWAPHVVCGSCRSTLESWYRGEKRKMKFGVPRIWREPTDHTNNCYFCKVVVTCHRRGKKTDVFDYPDLPSSLRPVMHCEELPVPNPPPVITKDACTSSSSETEDAHDDVFVAHDTQAIQHFPNQAELNDLIRDLGLTKSKAELLTSRLKQWNLLDENCRVTKQRQRHDIFSQYFTLDEKVCYCHDINGLFEEIEFPYDPSNWRLFVDSSTRSLKAVLLHNGNKYPSIPIAHSVHLKEGYENVKRLLRLVKYEEHDWEVIGDFKMIGFLTGLQGGFTKHPCFLCYWDSRATARHYETKDWPSRTGFVIGEKNVKWQPLVEQEKILMPPLHIKLGLIKQFVKALDHESAAFKHLEAVFPKLSEAKIKAGVFVGPQIKKLMKDPEFSGKLLAPEKRAWRSFVAVVQGFLGNNKEENYRELVDNLLKSYKEMGCRMSLKLHTMHSHLDFFKSNMGDYSEEHGERFHQDVMEFEKRYQGQYNERMMGDYVWGLVRETQSLHRRKSRKSVCFQ